TVTANALPAVTVAGALTARDAGVTGLSTSRVSRASTWGLALRIDLGRRDRLAADRIWSDNRFFSARHMVGPPGNQEMLRGCRPGWRHPGATQCPVTAGWEGDTDSDPESDPGFEKKLSCWCSSEEGRTNDSELLSTNGAFVRCE